MSITSSTLSSFMTTNPPFTQANYASELANTGNRKTDQKPTTATPSSSTDASTYTTTIYGTPTAPAPATRYTKEEREQHIDAYANRVKTLIEEMASAYEDPSEVVEFYSKNKELMNNMRNVALEEQAVETLLSKAKVTEKATTFTELMNQTQPA